MVTWESGVKTVQIQLVAAANTSEPEQLTGSQGESNRNGHIIVWIFDIQQGGLARLPGVVLLIHNMMPPLLFRLQKF